MVAKLFDGRPPKPNDRLLDPGCGTGAFIEGVGRWCEKGRVDPPVILGVESDPVHLAEAKRKLHQLPFVSLMQEDFLAERSEKFDYIIGNPPYVPITGLSDAEKARYRAGYQAAAGRFDLYLLFFEQALRLLKPGARLVYITPEKYLYVQSARPLRRQLASLHVEEVAFVAESTFGELTTYPTITTLSNCVSERATRVVLRDGQVRHVRFRANASSWLPAISGGEADRQADTLADVCIRISCGVATGADEVYVSKTSELAANLRQFAYPTVAGRQITVGAGMAATHSMLVPYATNGELLPEEHLAELGEYLRQPELRARLMRRTCASRKRWYSFHENPPLSDILRPKILCKDIGSRPYFLVDETGGIVPRHSVYYIVPRDPSRIGELCGYLNSGIAQAWLLSHCQPAANGFIRLQSHVLKSLPVPPALVDEPKLALAG